MMNEKQAIQAAKKAFPGYELVNGALCGKTYAFNATKNGESVMGCLCIDADNGEPCGSPDIFAIVDAFEKHGFEVR